MNSTGRANSAGLKNPSAATSISPSAAAAAAAAAAQQQQQSITEGTYTIMFNACKKEIFTPTAGLGVLKRKLRNNFKTEM